MKVGDLVKFKTTHPPKPWTGKVFLVSDCTSTHIKLVGAFTYGPDYDDAWLYRENWEVVSESR